MTFYIHWRDLPAAAWRWPDFSPAEIACRGLGRVQVLRTALGVPLIVTSGYRRLGHNTLVAARSHPPHISH